MIEPSSQPSSITWVFSGIGVFLLAGIIGIIKYYLKKNNMSKVSDPSTIIGNFKTGKINAGRDVTVTVTNNVETPQNEDTQQLAVEILKLISNNPMPLPILAVKLGITDKMLENTLDGMLHNGIVRIVGDQVVKI